MINLSHENMLLLTCIRGGKPDEIVHTVNDIMRFPFKWEEFLAAASWQGIASVAYYHLKGIQGGTSVPANVMDQLQKIYYGNTAKNTYLYKELFAILEAFNENTVDLIVLKGMALAKTVYSDIGLRQIGDIDLLVKKEHLHYAEKIMSDLGYIVNEQRSLEWLRENYYHIPYIHPTKNIKVEIHWHITYKSHPVSTFTYDSSFMNRCWERAQKAEILGKEIRILGPEDLLIHLSLHFMKHRFLSPEWGYKRCFISKGALIQLYDIAMLLKHYCGNINWERVHHDSREYKSDHILYATLFLVKEIMGEDTGLQGQLSRLIPVKFDPDIMNIMINRIFTREESFPGVNRLLTKSFGENTFTNGIIRILKIMFPPSEVMAERYSVPVSSWKLYLYYVMRPFDVLFRHRRLMSEMSRIKDETILSRWIYSQDYMLNTEDKTNRF